MLQFARGKLKYKSTYRLCDIYNFYVSQNQNTVSANTWSEIVKEFNKATMHNMIYNHAIFTLPRKLGSIRIRKKKKKLLIDENGKVDASNFAADWKKTKEMWNKKYPDLTPEEIAKIPIKEKKIIYILNEHTEGYTFKFYWDKIISDVPNQNYYNFKAVRTANREIKKALDTNPELQYYYLE